MTTQEAESRGKEELKAWKGFMGKTYKARNGRQFSDSDAQIIGEYLEKQFPDGHIDVDLLVDLAKKRSNPLHRYFEWDDSTAAALYRRDQARKIVKSITIVIEGDDIPAYQSVVFTDEDGNKKRLYTDTETCIENEDLWQQVIAQALREADRWSMLYKRYEDLGPIHNAIKQTKEKFSEKTRTTRS